MPQIFSLPEGCAVYLHPLSGNDFVVKCRDDCADGCQIEQQENQTMDEFDWYIVVGEVPHNNACSQRRQKIDEFPQSRNKTEAANQITREGCGVAQEEKHKTGRPEHSCSHFGVGQINEERRAAHSSGDRSKA